MKLPPGSGSIVIPPRRGASTPNLFARSRAGSPEQVDGDERPGEEKDDGGGERTLRGAGPVSRWASLERQDDEPPHPGGEDRERRGHERHQERPVPRAGRASETDALARGARGVTSPRGGEQRRDR